MHADGRPTPRRRRPRRRSVATCSVALLAVLLAVVRRQAAEGSIVNEGKTCFRPLSYPSHRQYELYDCAASATTEAAISAMQTAANTSDGIVFNSVCSETAACNRLQPALDQVKAAIESSIVFDTPVYVNMTFLSFCKEAQSGQLAIDANCKVVLGAASPYLVPLQDDDGIQRMYPKALARQWGYASDGDPDIYAYFNSDAHWFYPQDTNSTIDQEDIVFVIAHELLHGLGFLSQWSSDGTKLYPMVRTDVVVTPSLLANEKSLPKKFMGFTESAFDRLIGATDTDPVSGNRLYLSDVAKQWIAAGAPLAGQPLENAGAAIDENGTLSRLGVEMKLRSETAGALSVVDPGTKEAFLLLDTSFTPFLRGTSLTHVSQEKYWNATDALMVPTTRGGYKINPDNATMSDPLGGRGTKSSGSNVAVMYSGRVTLPHDRLVGPAIERVFSLIGYKTKNNPNPSNKPSLPSGTGVKIGNSAAAEGRPAGIFGAICATVALVGLSW